MNADQIPDDEGASLIELVFYVMILGVITTGIAVFFFNTWKAQASVSDQVDATGRGQAIASQIETAMRNGVDFSLPSGSTLLVATSITGASACVSLTLADGTPLVPFTWQSGVARHEVSAGVFEPFFTKIDDHTLRYSFDMKSSNGPTVHFEGREYIRIANLGALPGGGAQTCF